MLQTNFLKTALASMLVICTMGFSSCSSDEGEPEIPPTESSIVGKWDVSDAKTRAAGDAEYSSFEFTADNKYIITQPAVATNGDKYMLVVFGDYNVTSSKKNEFTLNLKEFGIIKISITKNTASITIDGVVYVAVKAVPQDTSDNTTKLCYTWALDKSYQLWHQDNGKKEELTMLGEDETITFTNNGTYMIYDQLTAEEIKDGLSQYNYGTWKWITSDIIEITYMWYVWRFPNVGPDDEPKEPEVVTGVGTSRYTITELASNKLTMEEISSFDPEQNPNDKYIMWFSR